MAKITRYSGNVEAFASAALGTERRVFGGVTQSDALSDQLTVSFLRGWGIVGPSDEPTREDFNAIGFTHGQFIAYLHQVGVPEWDVAQEYHANSIAQKGGNLYISLTDTNTGNDPETDTINWVSVNSFAEYYTDSGVANAYVLTASGGQPAPEYRDGMRIGAFADNTNTGASTVNVDGNGVTSLVAKDGTTLSGGEIVAGEFFEAVYDASAMSFKLVSDNSGGALTTVITASDAAWATQAKTKYIEFTVVGGGGGGGGVAGAATGIASSTAGAGGGAVIVSTSSVESTYNITIGAGGAGGAAGANVGTAGGSSSISSTGVNVTASGGGGGDARTGTTGNVGVIGATGGVGTGGDININGEDSDTIGLNDGVMISTSNSGGSIFGGKIKTAVSANGVSATTYGAGGGAASVQNSATNYAGGDGADGVVIVKEFF